jgi:hypothetical protein
MTVVEKALQLAQVVASELGMADMAVAYNRVVPHMEASGRPVIQVGADSITSGVKYLALYGGVFCVAEERKRTRVLPAALHSLARLPDPLVRAGSRKSGALQGKLWPRPPSA